MGFFLESIGNYSNWNHLGYNQSDSQHQERTLLRVLEALLGRIYLNVTEIETDFFLINNWLIFFSVAQGIL